MRPEKTELSSLLPALSNMLLSLAAAMVLLAPVASTAQTRQGIDLTTYCRNTYGSSAYATLLQNNAYGWACRLGSQNLAMDLTAACRQQYADGVAAAYYDYYNAYSWYCQLKKAYTSFTGSLLQLYVWRGRNVALMTPDTSGYVPTLMTIINGIDYGFDFYFNATGRKPDVLTNSYYQGLDTIVGLPVGSNSSCTYTDANNNVLPAPACGWPGLTGIELLNSTYNGVYSSVANYGLHDQTPYYELGRNFWFYGPKLEYVGSDNKSVITTGYAVAMRFLAMDYAGVTGAAMVANGQLVPFPTFRAGVERLVDDYRVNALYDWSNTLKLNQAVPNNYGLRGTDLFASIVLRLYKVHGASFINQVWKKAALLNNAVTTQDAVDNFVIAASQAAGVNLSDVFQYTWKWPVSPQAVSFLQTTLGNPIGPLSYL